jgi:hypothetical protein
LKSKTKTYILLIGVLGIWGIIAYKIMSAVNPKTPNESINSFEISFSPKTSTSIDTFTVKMTNRDPFLGTLTKKKKTIVKQKTISKKVDFEWIPIIYHGTIKKHQGNSQIFVVSINGQQYLLKIGQEINGVKLKAANAQRIKVTYKGHTKTVSKT